MSLQLSEVSFAYGTARVIQGLDLDVAAGEMVALLGASGCGKTTVLKLIAGLLPLDAGSIRLNGVNVSGIPTERRRIAMVFQKPLLFPYLSVEENIGFSLKLKNVGSQEIAKRVRDVLAMVRLEGYERRRPEELSGGQEQRVTLARALVSEPDLLLLDEPFAALDETLRVEIRSLVRNIQRRLKLTALFVTHDRDEAAAVAHRIAFLSGGKILQTATLRQFYEAPRSLEAARFFGWQIIARGGEWLAARPEKLRISDGNDGIGATVEGSVDLGQRVATTARLESGELIEIQHDPPELVSGAVIRVAFDNKGVIRFARPHGAANSSQ